VNIFVESRDNQVFIGYCWPGDSAYVDYFNEGARKFWSAQYSYTHFTGTNELYGIWIDMNEPSVFNGPEMSMPKDAHHYSSAGEIVEHKDIHNMYGRLMIEATYDGLMQRQTPSLRPFVLTRSVFFGS
jgi:alpha-glucosidase (family GH31 glycosyl hydrolase)